MDGFEWALVTLADYGADSPHRLQAQGVNVFFAPNIEPNTTVVDLGTGRVVRFVDGERRPQRGYYADHESLARFCASGGRVRSRAGCFPER
jgi:hypothetical protein